MRALQAKYEDDLSSIQRYAALKYGGSILTRLKAFTHKRRNCGL